ncbi:MAG: GGDEF domain-containing protein [Gammaproteobacteria bacterium]
MAIYRLLEGSYLVAVIDGLAVLAFAGIAWMVYVKRSVRAASIIMAAVGILTAVATISVRGGDQVIWMHPATVALFYLLKPKEAVAVALLAILAILPVVFDGRGVSQSAIVLASMAVTISLSVAFAALTAKQRRELRAITLLDPLTGAGNRRALDQTLDTHIERANENGGSFFMVMLDLDHFKTTNDQYGHAAGDAALCAVAKTIQANIRPTDSCYRTGGEEFVVVATASSIGQLLQIGERLRVAIGELENFAGPDAQDLKVTASLGLSGYVNGETRDSLYKRADDALYAAKRAGRNRVHLSKRLAQQQAA